MPRQEAAARQSSRPVPSVPRPRRPPPSSERYEIAAERLGSRSRTDAPPRSRRILGRQEPPRQRRGPATTHVSQRPVEQTVTLCVEVVEVERRPADRKLKTEEAEVTFEEKTVEMLGTTEEAEVSKEARVVGEVSPGKRVEERKETVKDSGSRHRGRGREDRHDASQVKVSLAKSLLALRQMSGQLLRATFDFILQPGPCTSSFCSMDRLVTGGGSAGLTTAIHLAQFLLALPLAHRCPPPVGLPGIPGLAPARRLPRRNCWYSSCAPTRAHADRYGSEIIHGGVERLERPAGGGSCGDHGGREQVRGRSTGCRRARPKTRRRPSPCMESALVAAGRPDCSGSACAATAPAAPARRAAYAASGVMLCSHPLSYSPLSR